MPSPSPLPNSGSFFGPKTTSMIPRMSKRCIGCSKPSNMIVDLRMMDLSSEVGCPTDGGSRGHRHNQNEHLKGTCQAAAAPRNDEQHDRHARGADRNRKRDAGGLLMRRDRILLHALNFPDRVSRAISSDVDQRHRRAG